MPLFVVAVRTLLQPIPPEDYWWHLAMGRIIAETGAIPSTNMYLYTLPVDAPFYDQPWLAQWLMYQIASAGGHIGTVGAHAALLLGTWVFVVREALRRGATPVVVGITAAAAHYVAASTLVPRTQMFAYPCFVAVAAITLRYADADCRRVTFWAVVSVATAFWANVHGSFVLAPLLVGAIGVGVVVQRLREREAIRPKQLGDWGVALLLSVLAIGATPQGVENLWYPVSILGATKGEGPAVLEWVPPGLYPQGIVFYAALLGACALLLLRRRQVPVWSFLVFALLSALAVSSVRGVIWWALAAVLIVGPHVAAWLPRPARETSARQGALNAAILGAFVLVTALCWPGAPLFRVIDPSSLFGEARLADEGQAAALSASNPFGLLDPLRDLDGRIFHEQSAAGFLEFYLAERNAPIVFVDQRLELLPPELWHEYFVLSRAKPGWRDVIARYDVRVFLLHLGEQPKLVDALRTDEDFRLVGEHGGWALFVRE